MSDQSEGKLFDLGTQLTRRKAVQTYAPPAIASIGALSVATFKHSGGGYGGSGKGPGGGGPGGGKGPGGGGPGGGKGPGGGGPGGGKGPGGGGPGGGKGPGGH